MLVDSTTRAMTMRVVLSLQLRVWTLLKLILKPVALLLRHGSNLVSDVYCHVSIVWPFGGE